MLHSLECGDDFEPLSSKLLSTCLAKTEMDTYICEIIMLQYHKQSVASDLSYMVENLDISFVHEEW